MSFEGEIGEIDLIARLVELGHEHFTGAIRFENDGIIKILYFKGGDVLSASTNDRTDSVDEILLRAGKVTREHVKQALAKRKENETLGDALLNLGFITRKELTWARRVQAIGVIRSINGWQAGSYTIVSDYLPKREEGTLFPLPQIIVELIVTDQDRVKFDKLLDSGEAVFSKASDFDDSFRRLGLNEDAARITNEIDGRRPAADVATAAGSDTFNVYKLLQALSALGMLHRATKPEVKPEIQPDAADDLATAGVADASDLWTSTSPSFELDDSPGFELDTPAPMQAMAVEAEPAPPADAMFEQTAAMAAWEAPPSVNSVASTMPAWDDEPEVAPATAPVTAAFGTPFPATAAATLEGSSMAVPPPMVIPPSHPVREDQWGFDDAQIETSRRAAAPPPVESDEAESADDGSGSRWTRMLFVLAALLLVAFAGYAGFNWWNARQAAATPELAPRATGGRHPVLHPRPASATGALTGTTGGPGGTTAVPSSMATPATAGLAATTTTTTTTTARTTATNLGIPAPAPATTAAAAPARTAVPTASVPPAHPAAAPVTIVAGTPNRSTATAPGTAMKRGGAPAVAARPATVTATAAPRLEQTSTGAAITNTVPGEASYDPDRAKYDANAREHAAAPPAGNFTVQFELVCQTSSLATAVKAGGDRIWYTPTSYRGHGCYRVFWGHYDTKEAAAAGAGELPASLRGDARPVVVRIPR